MNKTKWISPNFDKRKDDAKPSMIILHYTGMKTAEEALQRLCDPAAQVSAHYVVEEDGIVHALIPDIHRAWHAGVSFWRGITDVNSHSIGIEIVNPGHEFGYRTFPTRQIDAVIALCQRLMTTYQIEAGNILAHSDIAPSRKQDPGELFPWQKLARHGIGVWPGSKITKGQNFKEDLVAYGYNPDETLEDLTLAFHRRYMPEALVKL